MLGFRDSDNMGGTSSKKSPLVITTTIRKFDVSRILIDDDNSYNIMYSKLFENMGMERESLWLYESLDL